MVIKMNKILVLVYIPLLEKEYDIYIPINKKVGTIKKTIINTIIESSDGNINNFDNLKLYDKDSTILYDNDTIVKETTIRNGSKLILM